MPKRSEIWDHFEKCTGSEKVAICKYCTKNLSYKGTASNLKTHLKFKHLRVYSIMQRDASAAGTSGANVKREMVTPKEEMSPRKNIEDTITENYPPPYPTRQQLSMVIDFVVKRPVIESQTKCKAVLERSQKLWKALAIRLNKLGVRKSWVQWRKYWQDKKMAVRRKLSASNRCKINCDTKGMLVVDPLMEFSNEERRIMNIIARRDDKELTEPAEYIYDTQEVPEQEITTDEPLGSPGSASPEASSGIDTDENIAQRTAQSSRHLHRSRHKQPSFARLTERFLRLKEERLEVDRRNSRILEALLERAAERDRVMTQALQATAEGLRALAEAMRNKNNDIT
ncbi:hypothetical protein ABMA27_012521 [Loxostege sticticalis]|uniref:Regulatory protein zeste n=1 Tax=Loxostege sticticalis TaxID=481309 RepID=A0ABR3GYV9_LOXSC